MDLDEIQRLLRDGRYEVSLHAQQERLEEDLDLGQIEARQLSSMENYWKTIPTIHGEKVAWCSVLSEVARSTWSWDGRQ